MKKLSDISWNVSEKEYRADHALSYSTLARYEREGFNKLSNLFDKIETPSLTFGSCVDTLITGNEEEFNELFMVAELTNNLSDSLISIVKKLFNDYKDTYTNLVDIPEEKILSSIENIQWNNHWLPKTRVKKIKEDCVGYYNLLYIAGNRKIIDTYTYKDVLNSIDALKTSEATKFYFEKDNTFDNNIERYYQLKFKDTIEGIDYRCMADLLVVVHDKKIIVPVDLKTSSKPEWDFYKSFIDYRYDIQARLYWKIIRDNLNKDDYYKDFKLLDYNFIVVNKKTLTPLVWNCPFTQTNGTIVLGKNKQIELRSPFDIGEELNYYLTNNPKTPIDILRINNLKEFIDTKL